MYKITDSDLQDLEMLKNIENEVYDYYLQLFKLDKEGKKDSVEYKNIIERIKSIIILEESIFSRLITSKEQIDAIVKKLVEEWNLTFSTISIDVMFDKEELIKSRIVNKFNSSILDYYLKHPESRFGVYEESNEITEYTNRVNLYITTSNQYLITDTLNLALAIIGRLEATDADCKWAKYALAFQTKEVERDLTNNGFNINSNPFLINGLANTMFPDVKDSVSINETFFEKSFEFAIQSFFVYDDYSLLAPDNKIKSEWNMCYARSLLILMDQKQASKYLETLQELLKKFESSRMYYRTRGAIETILANYQKDKEIPQIVGLNL